MAGNDAGTANDVDGSGADGSGGNGGKGRNGNVDGTDGSDGVDAGDAERGSDVNVDQLLAEAGFDETESVLTRRQAEVLALRERGLRQSDIADRLGTSRANVSSIESSARENVTKAGETVAFAEALAAPVRVEIDEATDLYDVPKRVFDACDEVGVKVNHTAPDLMKVVSEAAGDAVRGREVRQRLFVSVTSDGTVRVRRP